MLVPDFVAWAEDADLVCRTCARDTQHAMSQKNVEAFIRSAYAKFNAADPSPSGKQKLASLDFYHPEAVYVNDANDPDPGIHSGIDAVREQVGQWVRAYPDLQVEPLEI